LLQANNPLLMRINKITQRRVVAIEANSISASPADVLLGSDKNTTNSINLKLALKRFLFPNENKIACVSD